MLAAACDIRPSRVQRSVSVGTSIAGRSGLMCAKPRTPGSPEAGLRG
jgi:hypothetical protein